ncbi:MAG TPA: cysteine synthase family protein [Chitinophagaceae bacterium]
MQDLATYKETPLIEKVRLLGSRIGRTDLHRITGFPVKKGVSIFAKKEWEQLSGSVKARAGYNIFRQAIEKGELTRNKILFDATSGNTGIAYATIGKLLNIRVTLCLPENASQERKDILKSLGAEIIYTSRFEGTDGSQQMAKRLAAEHPERYYYADQYKNDNNWKAHYYTTGPEIIEALPSITHFIAGLGTTGTFIGTGRKLKAWKPDVQLISMQPESAMHGLEGWKHMETAVVPTIYDPSLADAELTISTEETYETLKAAYRNEGLLLSPSSAANLTGALRLAQEIDEGVIVTVFPDNADKYGEVIKKLIP